MSKIEWTEKTWNPIVGCSIVSAGCTNCYAMKMAARIERMGTAPHYAGTTRNVKGHDVWTGKLAQAPDSILLEPLRRKKPTMWFVNSMSDLFHEDVPDEWILKVLDVIRATSHDGGANCGCIRNADRTEGQHIYQVLTKRSARMRTVMRRLRWDGERLYLADDDSRARVIIRNLWLGVSAEDQRRADERVPDLLATPAAVRFVSAEPLLGPIDFTRIAFDFGTDRTSKHNALSGVTNVDYRTRLDWVIVGGESGPGARPMHPDWARSIRDQCSAAGVAFFFKQHGEHETTVAAEHFQDYAAYDADASDIRDAATKCEVVWPDGRRQKPAQREWWAQQDFESDGDATSLTGCPVIARRVGKAVSGHLLDGREWNEMPILTREVPA